MMEGRSAQDAKKGDLEEKGWLEKARGLFDIFQTGNSRRVEQCWEVVEQINALEASMAAKSDEELAATTPRLRARLQAGEALPDVLPEAYAAVREVAKRVLGMRHFDVQLLGGTLLNDGCVAQMSTGEGKTLVATLPAYLNAIEGKGVYVVTVNDFLAERDAAEMGRIFRFLGLTCEAVNDSKSLAVRRKVFGSVDIVYLTARTLGFSYLGHLTAQSPEEEVFTRPLNFCVVDEVDSILLDESNQPLIMGFPTDDALLRSRLAVSDKVVTNLRGCPSYYASGEPMPVEMQEKYPGDFTTNVMAARKALEFTDAGQEKVVKMLVAVGALPAGSSPDALWDQEEPWGPVVLKSLEAHQLYLKDEHYTVIGDEVVVVDTNTGRPAFQTRWQHGLHQAIEQKEGLEVRTENKTIAKITFQMFFRLFNKLSGMTGTAESAAFEMYLLYRLPVAVVPTNRPRLREDKPLELYWNQEDKFQMLLIRIVECYKRRQPVLIGTESIDESLAVAAFLRKSVPLLNFQLLNARPDLLRQESEIVAQAGLPDAVTISTSMAGRGTDIKLGGDPRGLTKGTLTRALTPHLVEDAETHMEELLPFSIPINFDKPDGTILGPKTEGLLFRAQALAKTRVGCVLSVADFSEFVDYVMVNVDTIMSQALREESTEDQDAFLVSLVARSSLIDGDDMLKGAVAAGLALLQFYRSYCAELGKQVRDAGGLMVIGAAVMPSERAAAQLCGRAGRQGDPGESVLMACATDIYMPSEVKILLSSGAGEMMRKIEQPIAEYGIPNIKADVLAATGTNVYANDERMMLARNSLKEQDEVFQEFSRDLLLLRRRLLSGSDGDVLDVLLRYLQDSADELVATYADPRVSPAFWSLDKLTDDLAAMVNGPDILRTDAGLHVQLNYMVPEQRVALLVALQNGAPLPPHPSDFPVTLRAKAAITRSRQTSFDRMADRPPLEGRFTKSASLLREYLGESLAMALFDHEQATIMLWRLHPGFVSSARRSMMLRTLDDLYSEFLARSMDLQSGVSLQNPEGGNEAYRSALRKDFTTVLQTFRRKCAADVFRIEPEVQPLTVDAGDFLKANEARQQAANGNGLDLRRLTNFSSDPYDNVPIEDMEMKQRP